MSMKRFLSVLVLVLVPMGGWAEGCSHLEQQAMSCAVGSVYDATTKGCVPEVSS